MEKNRSQAIERFLFSESSANAAITLADSRKARIALISAGFGTAALFILLLALLTGLNTLDQFYQYVILKKTFDPRDPPMIYLGGIIALFYSVLSVFLFSIVVLVAKRTYWGRKLAVATSIGLFLFIFPLSLVLTPLVLYTFLLDKEAVNEFNRTLFPKPQ